MHCLNKVFPHSPELLLEFYQANQVNSKDLCFNYIPQSG